MKESINPWRIISQKEIYENPWIGITEYNVINPSGGQGIYGKVHFKNIAVGVIALDGDMNTFLVGQFRFAIGQYSWEIPEGGSPEGTDVLESAKRELLEETGLTAGRWTELMGMHLSNSVSDEYSFIYLATGLTQGIAAPEETEKLQVRKIKFEHAYEMVKKGEITDSVSVAAILRLQLLLQENEIIL